MEIPNSLIVQYIYQYAGYPEYNRYNGVYNACCPVCREGKSWGKKKRLYYMPQDDLFYCHNCQSSWKPLEWMCEVSGKPYFEILEEAESEAINMGETHKEPVGHSKRELVLPYSPINLFNEQELSYYSNNKVVQDAIKLIKERRLDTAVNKVDLYVSVKDHIYKNRLCIPFRDSKGEIIFFQCRSMYKSDEKEGNKYISKYNAEKSIFNIDKIDIDFPYIFLFEGPIDSMFVKNGVGVAGLSFTDFQEQQLSKFFTHEKIWVLDNHHIDESAMEKSLKLVKNGEKVFVWPKKLAKYKDLNDLCIDKGLDEINPQILIKMVADNEAAFRTKLI